jgi:hypothetical protein
MTSTAKQYTYDVALSYSGEDRNYADALAEALRHRKLNVFYDKYEKSTLWGKNLYTYLSDVYQNKARYCVMFLSQHYAAKLWTNHEREAAQARAFSENEEYILPVRLDNTVIPGIPSTVAYLSWPPETAETIADAIVEKMGNELLRKAQINPEEILDFINTATSNIVLIMGNATNAASEDALKVALRKYGYLPVFLDVSKPRSQDLDQAGGVFAYLSHFIIADLTNATGIYYELVDLVPHIPSVPVQPLIMSSEHEFDRFEFFTRFPWVLPIYKYKDLDDLLDNLKEQVIDPAEQKAKELEKR